MRNQLLIIIYYLLSIIGVCIDGDVKIADGPNEYEGRAEICYDGEWGTICDDDYHENTAYVICKQLNLPLNSELSIF